MSFEKIKVCIETMEPQDAASAIGRVMQDLFPLLDDEARLEFVMGLVGEPAADKVASMVHFWLAECMGEGVDPTKMCQNLVDKVAQSQQLSAVAEPEVLGLFENWLEELESEVISFVKKDKALTPADLANGLAVSHAGAAFLITKLKREGKI